jgi:hypothetical protein
MIHEEPSMADKIDFKKVLQQFYKPKIKGLHVVEVPDQQFLMIDGVGDPNKSHDYQLSIEALYAMSYGVKFTLKREGYDYIIPPLEGLWWMEDMNEFSLATKERWQWTMMVMQPEWVSTECVEKVRWVAIKKKPNALFEKIRFSNYKEGLSVQILYTGPYVDEAPTIAEMHSYIHANGYRIYGKHHEIYLSDVRKSSPENLQTILRQPIIIDKPSG